LPRDALEFVEKINKLLKEWVRCSQMYMMALK
jgi:hypothetical protein